MTVCCCGKHHNPQLTAVAQADGTARENPDGSA